jgi:hypothetical protein
MTPTTRYERARAAEIAAENALLEAQKEAEEAWKEMVQ